MTKINLPDSWLAHLQSEFQKDYMLKLKSFLSEEIKSGKTIYPHGDKIFEAFNQTPFDKVKVVILGQDPYHGPGQAHGLCFSVRPGVRTPPSLVNIYKELKADLNLDIPDHGYLQSWSEQGVFLLNNVLTVERSKAASHQNKGWETFTNKVVEVLNQRKQNLVFLLWGSPAQKKGAGIDSSRHLVLKCPHPSPLSAHRGFFGCRHFSQANEYLRKNNIQEINWQVPQTLNQGKPHGELHP